jgi:16S rRNA (cytosine967-C5)-methyltransferase
VAGEAPEAVASALRLPGPRRPRAILDTALLALARALPRPGRDGPLAQDAKGRPLAAPADPATALGLRHSVPDRFAARLLQVLGAREASLCLAALNRDPVLTLRVNGARASRPEVIAALRNAGVEAREGEGSLSVRVEDRAGLFDAPPIRKGLVEVQDEGSQAVVDLCRPGPAAHWLDFCAGSGGKALGLAAAGARVTAWDASAPRLAELPRRARRAGLAVSVSRAEPAGTYDGVLVDAPCSGSGALSREPDARWRVGDAALARYSAVQAEILSRAAERVGPGGTLVYATCSLFREEGEEVVRRFLDGHPGFALDEEARRWPHRDPGAGFYLARLTRKAAAAARGRKRGPAGARGRRPSGNPRRPKTRLTRA